MSWTADNSSHGIIKGIFSTSHYDGPSADSAGCIDMEIIVESSSFSPGDSSVQAFAPLAFTIEGTECVVIEDGADMPSTPFHTTPVFPSHFRRQQHADSHQSPQEIKLQHRGILLEFQQENLGSSDMRDKLKVRYLLLWL